MVSVIIVTRNSSENIINCIKSIINQFTQTKSWELLIIDGSSDDNTKVKALEFLKNTGVKYRILDNPKKSLASGWNLGIKVAQGTYVVRPDAHAELLPNYISNGIKKLEIDYNLAAVGGTLIAKSRTKIGKLISIVLSNPIGVGNSLFRVGVKRDTFTNTVVYAIYRKKIIHEVGGLNEELDRNQDIDLHNRIIKAGYKLMTADNMKAIYYNRSSLKTYLNQSFLNGSWITKGKTRHFKHLIPMIFVMSMLVIFCFSSKFLFMLLALHLLTSFIFYIHISHVYNPLTLIFLWYLTFLLHFTYGIGSLCGLYKRLSDSLLALLMY